MENTRDTSLDAGLLSAEEKHALQAGELPPPNQSPAPKKKGISPPILVALIVTSLLTLSFVLVPLAPRMSSCMGMRHHARPDDAAFAQLLHSADPDALREVLA
ncbi:hypothetical protein IMZ48_45105, partial [Candidatus Bathyarchaeota archaeon]|nr:hypothetical protein [Candidatus Bathyarchaeota archaeon]